MDDTVKVSGAEQLTALLARLARLSDDADHRDALSAWQQDVAEALTAAFGAHSLFTEEFSGIRWAPSMRDLLAAFDLTASDPEARLRTVGRHTFGEARRRAGFLLAYAREILGLPLRLDGAPFGAGLPVFLAHAAEDGDEARALAEGLTGTGMAVFSANLFEGWAPAAGEDIGATARHEIDRSAAFLLLVGPHGVGNWPLAEAIYAGSRQTRDPAYPVLPLLLPGARPTDLPAFASARQKIALDSSPTRWPPTPFEILAAKLRFACAGSRNRWPERRNLLLGLPARLQYPVLAARAVAELAAMSRNGNDLYWARETLRRIAAASGPAERTATVALAQGVLDHIPASSRAAAWAEVDRWGFRDVPPEPVADGALSFSTADAGARAGGPRQVTFASGFQILSVPVTNRLYECFDPSHREARPDFDDLGHTTAGLLDDHPVVSVTAYEALLFAEWLGDGVRLPRETEWEFACRAGEPPDRAAEAEEAAPPEFVQRRGNVGYRTRGVRDAAANAWGLRGMRDDVWEWCVADVPFTSEHGTSHALVDPERAPDPTGLLAVRVRRGRGLWYGRDFAQSAYRDGLGPGDCWPFLGFRLVRPAADPLAACGRALDGPFEALPPAAATRVRCANVAMGDRVLDAAESAVPPSEPQPPSGAAAAPQPATSPRDDGAAAPAAAAPAAPTALAAAAVAVAGPGAEPAATARALWQRFVHGGALTERSTVVQELRERCERLAVGRWRPLMRYALAEIAARVGRWADCRRFVADAEPDAAPALRFVMALRLAAANLDHGRVAQAGELLDGARNALADAGLGERAAFGLDHAAARQLLGRGEPEAAFERFDALRRAWLARGERPGAALAAGGQAVACLGLGQPDAAERWARRAAVLSEQPGAPRGAAWARALVAEMAGDGLPPETEAPLGEVDWLRCLSDGDLDLPGARAWLARVTAQDPAAPDRLAASLRGLGLDPDTAGQFINDLQAADEGHDPAPNRTEQHA